MTYYVPDWDDNSHGVTVSDNANFCHMEKGAAHQHQHQQQRYQLQQQHYHQHHHSSQQKKSDTALVPNHDVLDTLTHTRMQEDAGTHSTGKLECSSIPTLDIPVIMRNPSVHEDEMLSWLRYPLEDSYDRNYCSEVFGDLMNPHVLLVKDVFLQHTMKEPESAHVLNIDGNIGCGQVGLQHLTSTASMICPPKAGIESDAAMALGAGRAAGILSQTGSEAFHGVRTNVNPCALLKSLSSPSVEPSSDGKKAVQSMDPIATVPPVSSGFNFSLFSRPVATTLDSLRLVGAASGPTNVERVRQPLAKEPQLPCEAFAVDSNRSMVLRMSSSQNSTELTSQGRVAKDYQGPLSLPCGSPIRVHTEAAELNSHITGLSISENVLGTTEAAEALSGSSSERIAQEVLTPRKKSSPSAQYSEDIEDVAANAKKPPPGPRAVKRSRAAETHNESEKKRRNKINVKLKALQSLIPNSNKTDKASVLDEAIEYTKMLQAQVQLMSMKTGMFFPTMMASGMHYVPVQQMPTFSHIGMGIGMGMDMGIGMHVANMNATTTFGVGVTAGTSAGTGLNLSPIAHQPIYEVASCLPTACTNESYKVMMAQQPQPLLTNAQMNADVFSTSLQQRPLHENHITNSI